MISTTALAISTLSFLINMVLFWRASKYYKFKRNYFVYSFLASAILYVLSSISLMFNEVMHTPLSIRILLSPIFLVLWFVVIIKAYKISFKQSVKFFFFVLLWETLIYIAFFIILSFTLPFFRLDLTKERTCEEQYGSFPLSLLPESHRESAYDSCILKQAIKEENPSLCEEAKSISDCYSGYAQKVLDETYCEKVSGQEKQSCYSRIAIEKSDATLCSEVGESREYFCYYQIARDTNNFSACNNLPPSGTTHFGSDTQCRAEAEMDSALLKGDLNYCETLQTDSARYVCYTKLAKIKLDESYCYVAVEIPERGYTHDSCVASVKKWQDRKSQVSNLPEEYWRT